VLPLRSFSGLRLFEADLGGTGPAVEPTISFLHLIPGEFETADDCLFGTTAKVAT
jgi:hypothetical protein